MVIVPVPWEVTVSQQTGTAGAPKKILDNSFHIDLFSRSIAEIWKLAVCMLPFPEDLLIESNEMRTLATAHILALENGETISATDLRLERINEACENMNTYVKNTTLKHLRERRMVGVLGGDHSTPLGLLRALGEIHDRFGILQIDAHADLRKKYEGFSYSHASVMLNALKLPSVGRLVQVGVRDFCEEEYQVISRSMGRIKCFYDEDMKSGLYSGKAWETICREIVAELPDKVYISFDIDGLDPKLCPNTGTPVPGGLEFDQVRFLMRVLLQSGKKIIGFDLSEVSGKTRDAQTGARLLFELCQGMALSQGRLRSSG